MKRGFVVAVLVLGLVASACTSQQQSSAPETASPSTPSVTAQPDASDDLPGLEFATFLDESYARLAVRRPEALTSAGVADEFGMRNDLLDDLSPAYLEETQALEAEILDLLGAYDRDTLSPEDQTSYDLYEWYLDQLASKLWNHLRRRLFGWRDGQWMFSLRSMRQKRSPTQWIVLTSLKRRRLRCPLDLWLQTWLSTWHRSVF